MITEYTELEETHRMWLKGFPHAFPPAAMGCVDLAGSTHHPLLVHRGVWVEEASLLTAWAFVHAMHGFGFQFGPFWPWISSWHLYLPTVGHFGFGLETFHLKELWEELWEH